jgi:hypothetical protein
MHSFGGAIDAVAFAHATNTLVDELTKNLSN